MNNIMRIVESGVCTGCGACNGCEHLRFEEGPLGFPMPRIDQNCTGCGACVSRCSFDPLREDG